MGGVNPIPVIGVNRLKPVKRSLLKTLGGSPPDVGIGGTDVKQAFFSHAMHPEHLANMFGQLAKLFFAVAQGGFGLDAGADLRFQRIVDGGEFGDALTDAGFKFVIGSPQVFFGLLQCAQVMQRRSVGFHPGC